MSYQSLKRVLGETNLERKCRLLFGLCLLVLIAGSFGWVWFRTEQLVYDKDRSTGRRLVDSAMLEYHWDKWDTGKDNGLANGGEAGEAEIHDFLNFGDMRKRLSSDLQNLKYDWKFIALEKTEEADPPEDEWERKLLLRLRREQKEQLAERAERSAAEQADAEHADAAAPSPRDTEAAADIIPVFGERPRAKTPGEYHYYQPVYWKASCTLCHSSPGIGAVSAAEVGDFGNGAPFRVVKVVIPDHATQGDLSWNRAILIATVIITVFVAMVALYVIVRYVIVKPLKHLRDVSDEISRGNTSLRADIHTGDEFEDLAASFNRMLRHLTDAQAELREVNTDLDAKVDQLARLNMQLYEMNRLKSDFLASMSHELRTPLNSIIGFSEVLLGIDVLDDKQRRYAGNIRRSGRVLLDMINDILDLAKMESGKMEVRPTEFEIAGLVAAQCDVVRSLAEEKNIDLEVRVEADLPALYQDRAKVQQILTNLLSNAIKFTPEGGRIGVSAARDGRRRLELTVTDTGVGIAEEDHEIIFEKFRQGTAGLGKDTLTREYSGTGLGLSIVKELCILLGGEVTFRSELGKGSRFAVRLPWTLRGRAERESAFSARLDDLTGPRRRDFAPHGENPPDKSADTSAPAGTSVVGAKSKA